MGRLGRGSLGWEQKPAPLNTAVPSSGQTDAPGRVKAYLPKGWEPTGCSTAQLCLRSPSLPLPGQGPVTPSDPPRAGLRLQPPNLPTKTGPCLPTQTNLLPWKTLSLPADSPGESQVVPMQALRAGLRPTLSLK